MSKTISLSTDMNTFYLISVQDAVTALSLAGDGVDVSLSGGDVTAVEATAPATGTQKTYSTRNGQYTVYFDNSANAMEFIGSEDMDVFRDSYSLSGNTVNVKRAGDDVVVTF